MVRINENFGRIDLNMPIGVVLDIPPEVEGGVQLPVRLDQWGAESAPAYRALIGLSFLWHEPGRTHAPRGGKWLRKTGLDPYDRLTDDDAIALAYPSSVKTNRRELARRAWGRVGEPRRARRAANRTTGGYCHLNPDSDGFAAHRPSLKGTVAIIEGDRNYT